VKIVSLRAIAPSLALLILPYCILPNNTARAQSGDSPVSTEAQPQSETKEAVATLAGGCFWCTEAVYERMQGVNDVVSGYIGGHVKNPSYEQVCAKNTGHAEAVEVYYDPTQTNFEELLKVFFKTHDPTTLNQQGADRGPQYRSSIFYHNEEQKKIAEAFIAKLNKSGEFRSPIVTKLESADKFYPAEEYHQDYYRRNPNAGYCQVVVREKVQKFNESFKDKIKETAK
jgi:peptide-methionine (S)-S-oxide reductase